MSFQLPEWLTWDISILRWLSQLMTSYCWMLTTTSVPYFEKFSSGFWCVPLIWRITSLRNAQESMAETIFSLETKIITAICCWFLWHVIGNIIRTTLFQRALHNVTPTYKNQKGWGKILLNLLVSCLQTLWIWKLYGPKFLIKNLIY